MREPRAHQRASRQKHSIRQGLGQSQSKEPNQAPATVGRKWRVAEEAHKDAAGDVKRPRCSEEAAEQVDYIDLQKQVAETGAVRAASRQRAVTAKTSTPVLIIAT